MDTSTCSCSGTCTCSSQCNTASRCGIKMGSKCFAWTSILVGALVAVGLGFLLNLYSVSIGLSILKADPSGVLNYAVGGFIGLLIGTIISMFIAGWLSGVLSGGHSFKHNLGLVYGFSTWALALIISIVLASQISSFIASYTNFLAYPTIELRQTTGQDIRPQEMKSQQVASNAQKLADNVTLTKSALATFLLFFTGALSSSIGGVVGVASVRRCCKDDYPEKNLPKE